MSYKKKSHSQELKDMDNLFSKEGYEKEKSSLSCSCSDIPESSNLCKIRRIIDRIYNSSNGTKIFVENEKVFPKSEVEKNRAVDQAKCTKYKAEIKKGIPIISIPQENLKDFQNLYQKNGIKTEEDKSLPVLHGKVNLKIK